jgi:hypothetical protein
VLMTLFLTTATITSAYAQNATNATMGVYYDSKTGLYYDIPLQGDYCLDFNEDRICDVDFHNGIVVTYGALAEDDDDNDGNDNDDDNDDGKRSDLDDDSNDNDNDCQSQDDFCDNSEGCESESVDCIDDRGFDEDDYNG